jgi:hypothetical protein
MFVSLFILKKLIRLYEYSCSDRKRKEKQNSLRNKRSLLPETYHRSSWHGLTATLFLIINLDKKKKKIMDTGSWIFFFNKKIILDYYFCLKSDPATLFLTFCLQIYFQWNFFISSLFHLFFLILTCSCQYSYNLMLTRQLSVNPVIFILFCLETVIAMIIYRVGQQNVTLIQFLPVPQ